MKIYEKAGLVPAGKNEDGEQDYIGTKEQWDKYDEMSLAKAEAEMEHERIMDDLDNHNCTASPEDGCDCQKYA